MYDTRYIHMNGLKSTIGFQQLPANNATLLADNRFIRLFIRHVFSTHAKRPRRLVVPSANGLPRHIVVSLEASTKWLYAEATRACGERNKPTKRPGCCWCFLHLTRNDEPLLSAWWFQSLGKIWQSVGMMIFPTEWEKHVPNHQPVIGDWGVSIP